MTQTRELLLLNAVECWLHHYQGVGEHTDQYNLLRDELREAYNESMDVPEIKSKITRKRSSAKPSDDPQQPAETV